MSEELAETYNAIKEAGQRKRASNRDAAPRILEEHGVSFTSHNAGAHLIVVGAMCTADFWPGTGKYISRPGRPGAKPVEGRGIFNLMKLVN